MLKKKGGKISGEKGLLVAIILLLCIVFGGVQYAAPVCGDEDSLLAEVTIVSPVAESYGARVVASSHVFLRWFALGEPDRKGAWMLRRGWIDIELKDVVTDCNQVSVWVAKRGWRSPGFKVYVSADGSSWTKVESGSCTTGSYTRYEFGGDFGDVKYVKVKRNGAGRWSVMLLDAVMAERR